MYEELASVAKLHFLQGLLSRILVDMVFDAYFVGMSDEQTATIRQMEILLTSFGKSLSRLCLANSPAATDESINQWRASTLALIRDADGTEQVVEKVIARTNRILDAISPPQGDTSSRDNALRALVSSSVDLARLLVVQKAVLRVHMPQVLPHQRVLFEPETMDDVGGEDEDALAQREIWCVVFPGVIKTGGENGAQMQFRNVIAKARVLCSPED